MRRVRKRAKRKAVRKLVRKRRVKRAGARLRRAVKKRARRRVARKKSVKLKRGGTKYFVYLDPTTPIGSKKVYLDRNKGDKICWKNLDTVAHRIVFNVGEWPFGGSQEEIRVKAGRSKTKKVRKGATKMPYDYDIVPAVKYVAGTPPDGPSVVVGGE